MTRFVEVKKESVTMSSRIEQIIDEIEEYIDHVSSSRYHNEDYRK